MDKTCKSNANTVVAISLCWSGERVINTWASYRDNWDNLLKGKLIPDNTSGWHQSDFKVGDRKA